MTCTVAIAMEATHASFKDMNKLVNGSKVFNDTPPTSSFVESGENRVIVPDAYAIECHINVTIEFKIEKVQKGETVVSLLAGSRVHEFDKDTCPHHCH